MIRAAIWVLEQEYKALRWIWQKGGMSYDDPSPGVLDKKEQVVGMAAFTAAAAQTAVVGSLGYTSIFWVGHRIEEAQRWLSQPTKFIATKAGYVPQFVKRQGAKKLALKIGARAIPYAGWALFAYDMYSVGKWAHKKYVD